MPVSHTKLESLPHALFLQRVSSHSAATSLEGRLGQGAFLALRLVDLLAPSRAGGTVSDDAFHYQSVATDRFCRELRSAATEGAHIHGVAAAAADARQAADVRLLVPALFAYALFLENELRLDEALDVLGTLLEVGGDRLLATDAVAARLRIARANRKLNRFDEAEAVYAEAGELAAARGDRYSELLSRIGSASVLWGRGNLAGAEQAYRSIVPDASGHPDAVARAEHGLGVTLYARGQPDEAAWHAWREFELYEDEDSRLRALNDIGGHLLAVGEVRGAERALSEVVRRGGGQDNVSNALIELMHCASYRRDRVGFARWRERCEARVQDMPPNIRADFYLKQGIGHARFGQFGRAETLMNMALEIAGGNRLHEFEFRIERIKSGLRDCEPALQAEELAATEPIIQSEALREVSASLTVLGA